MVQRKRHLPRKVPEIISFLRLTLKRWHRLSFPVAPGPHPAQMPVLLRPPSLGERRSPQAAPHLSSQLHLLWERPCGKQPWVGADCRGNLLLNSQGHLQCSL